MNRESIILSVAILLLLACNAGALAQSGETKRYEVGAQFSSLSIDKGFETRTEPGFGGRFTFNLTDNIALEAQGDLFPRSERSNAFRNGGRAVEGLFGVKIGKRFEKFGLFAKARPGFISFSQGAVDFIPTGGTNPFTAFDVRVRRLTHFAADIGGVLEFYPTRRIFTRIDAGDTIIRYGKTTINSFSLTPGGTFTPFPITFPSDTTHNFQFSAGVGFRF
ncbi:MAG TPA: outer membrane beta-barrel protein [Pyrinomonadaceae bacterium]